MCNLTSLAMVLELLGIENPSSDMQFEDYLEYLRVEKKYASRGNIDSRISLSELLGAELVETNFDIAGANQTKITNILTMALREGYGVILSIPGGPGHLVRLEEINEDGLIVDDPYGYVDLIKRVSGEHGYTDDTKNITGDQNRGDSNLWKWEDVNQIIIRRAEFYNLKN